MTNVNDVNVKAPDHIDFEAYDKTLEGGKGESKPKVAFPPKGVYDFTTQKIEWDRTKDGYLQATLEFRLNAPGEAFDGHAVRFQNVNTKRWPNRNASSMGDYLLACGTAMPTGQTDEEYQALVNATLNAGFKGRLNWEGRNKLSGERIKGMESFPAIKDEHDKVIGYQSFIRLPNGDAVFANSKISSYIAR